MNKSKLYVATRLLMHSGDVIEQNKQVELTDKDAAPLLALNPPAITEANTHSPVKQRPDDNALFQDELITAIKSLDKANDTLWTKSGVPTTQAVEAVVGYQISAAERDIVWAIYETAENA